MAYADLREFIAALEKNQELKRIPFEVDPAWRSPNLPTAPSKPAAPRCCLKSPRATAFRC
jgi:3-polyprenyl-4-hydroxybenzoate decarboxylase